MNKKEKEGKIKMWKTIQLFEISGRKCLRDKRYSEALDRFNEAAHEYQRNGNIDEAIKLAEEGIEIAKKHKKLLEGSLLERFLSECHAQMGNKESCYRHILGFRKMALDCGNKSQEQLSYHVEAWCIRHLYIQGEVDRMEVQSALEKARIARDLVEQYKKHLKGTDAGGPKHRTAQIYILEAQLNNILGNKDKALRLLDKANSFITYRSIENDKSLRFEMLSAKCSIAPVEQRVSIAELMDEEAPENRKAQTLCEMSHQYVLANRVMEAYKELAKAYIVHFKQFTPIDLEEAERRLCISQFAEIQICSDSFFLSVYRLVQYLKIVRNPKREPKISKCELYEAVGDLYDKYFQTLAPDEKKEYTNYVRDNILKNYEKMLEFVLRKFKRNEGDMLRAYQGIALVYGDLEDIQKSKKYFELRLELLKKMGASKEKVLDTRVSIFNCMCKLNYTKLDKLFEELNGEVERDDTKRELFDVWANYWINQRNEQKAKEWREVVDSIPDVLIKNEEDETDVLFWRLSKKDILDKCKEDRELIKVDSMTEYQLKKTNEKGETKLHEAAMEPNNEAIVERLCRRGCNVDAKDHGGWTPLSEAVVHNQFGNAQVLIRYGADVNTRSTQSLMNEESQSSSDELKHGGLTPLMDACTNGFIDIAELLIDNKARLDLKDASKWTAYDHLKVYMDAHDSDEKMIKFAEKLKILTSKCVPLTDIPTCNIRTKKALPEAEDLSPDDEEDEMILAKAASRKRRISNSPDHITKHTKRRQRGEENIRYTPSPVYIHPSPTSVQKRSLQPSMRSFCKPKRLHRQNSSSSLNSNHRHSLSPRRSISPTTTVRSAPSESGWDNEVQVLGVRRSNGKTNPTSSPRVLQPMTAQRQVPAPRPEIIQNNSDITVKCYFECSSDGVTDDIRPPVKIRMKQ
ncbi:hypothetical protein CAEBREN_31069 [Caenorhabditis brenneri]|uniref:Uncharacterized protein n=1 Tax=Caenorhabditis brenneri TaxID=135651 RepID=G0NK59_CAEBE|nr:hypothetical protein CAEBREN_31069 [Caenorhabditis brenneri]